MMAQGNLTTEESAKQILGKNFISIREVLGLFSTNLSQVSSYEIIPFSKELLYRLGGSEIPFILFPGLPYYGRKLKPLTTQFLMEGQQFGKFFDISEESRIPALFHINQSVCEPRWYLISKKVLSLEDFRKFILHQDFAKEDCSSEFMVVYIFAWIILHHLRGEELFMEGPVGCSDKTTTRGSVPEFYLKIYNKQISLMPWQPKNQDRPLKDLPMFVPSIFPYTS